MKKKTSKKLPGGISDSIPVGIVRLPGVLRDIYDVIGGIISKSIILVAISAGIHEKNVWNEWTLGRICELISAGLLEKQNF